MGGYAARQGGASGLLDPLQVDCLTFAGADGRFVLIVAEVLCVNEDLAGDVRRRVTAALAADGTPTVDVWACATHTHAGPELGCAAGGGHTPAPWRSRIGEAAVGAARGAVASERECAGTLRTGDLRDIGSPRGSIGEAATVCADVLTCRERDGRLSGVLAVVPVHPTVLPASSRAISGDLTGAVRRSLRVRLRGQGAPWVVVATGAAGDISTRRTRREQTPAECARLGDAAAAQLAALLAAPGTDVWEAGSGAAVAARRRLTLPARAHDADQLHRLRATLEDEYARERRHGASAGARPLETALQGVDVAERHERSGGETVALSLSAARVGRLGILGIGAEPFHSLAGDLRERCDDPALVLGYANGHAGYLPDAAAFRTTQYEALSSPLHPTAAATTVASLIELQPDPTED
jgi:hypothetical protein